MVGFSAAWDQFGIQVAFVAMHVTYQYLTRRYKAMKSYYKNETTWTPSE
jgi:hypothetical protein